jgi:tetratricopeptide (TPR) repeat protein
MLMALALQLADRDQLDAAETLFMRALSISKRSGRLSLMLSDNYSGLGIVAFKHKEWRQAYELLRQANGIAIARERATSPNTSPREANRRAPQADTYLLQAVAAYRAAEEAARDVAALRDDAFEIAQRAERSLVAGALAQTAARISKGLGPLADLVRERQDLVLEWQRLDKRLEMALSSAAAQRDDAEERRIQERLGAISRRMDTIDARLAKEFPDFAKLSDPAPLPIREVQALLHPGEVLVFMAQRKSQTLVWVVGRERVSWYLAPLGQIELEHKVAALRCGLDESAWYGDGAETCRRATGAARPSGDALLPFDGAAAYSRYQALLEPAAGVTQGAILIVVASGPLAKLPFHVLVTEPPVDKGRTAWLARRNAVAYLGGEPEGAALVGAAEWSGSRVFRHGQPAARRS